MITGVCLTIYLAIGALLSGLYAGAMRGKAEAIDKAFIMFLWFFAIIYAVGYSVGKGGEPVASSQDEREKVPIA